MAQRQQGRVWTNVPFQNIPNEMYFKIFSFLDMDSFRLARRVSKRWKVVADASRKLSFVCDLTDESVETVIKTNEPISCLRIHDFSGKGNKVLSATRGTGRIVGFTESINLIGPNINGDEVGKMMKCALATLEELLFQDCQLCMLLPVFALGKPFESLFKLTVSHKSLPNRQETKFLDALSSESIVIQLPTLAHFKINYGFVQPQPPSPAIIFPSPNDVFANYLALGRLLLRYRRRLKTVEITRNDEVRNQIIGHVLTENVEVTPLQLEQIQECLAGYEEIELDSFQTNAVGDEGDFPWILETNLMQRQRNLKELFFENECCFIDQIQGQPFPKLLPNNRQNLTKVIMSLSISPGMDPVDLSVFSQCPALQTLWLEFYLGVQMEPDLFMMMNFIRFINLEQLPTTITSLHLKPCHDDTYAVYYISRDQVQWIVGNLKKLESLWIQLILTAHGGLLSNIDVRTFRELRSMPNIRNFMCDILKVGLPWMALHAGADRNGNPVLLAEHISLQDIEGFLQVCENMGDRVTPDLDNEDPVFIRRLRVSVKK